MPHFNCRLSNIGPSDPFSCCQLVCFGGRMLTIDGQDELVPFGLTSGSGGIQVHYNNCSINKVAGQTLVANTLYYVYAYMLNGVMTLDFSTTDWTIDSEWGYEVHSTDRTRTLVGMVYAQNVAGQIVTRGGARQQTCISRYNQIIW